MKTTRFALCLQVLAGCSCRTGAVARTEQASLPSAGQTPSLAESRRPVQADPGQLLRDACRLARRNEFGAVLEKMEKSIECRPARNVCSVKHRLSRTVLETQLTCVDGTPQASTPTGEYSWTALQRFDQSPIW